VLAELAVEVGDHGERQDESFVELLVGRVVWRV
jgi:hypothetical protein